MPMLRPWTLWLTGRAPAPSRAPESARYDLPLKKRILCTGESEVNFFKSMTARKPSLLLPVAPLNHIFEMLTFNCMSRGMVHLKAKILLLVTRQVIPNMRLIVFRRSLGEM